MILGCEEKLNFRLFEHKIEEYGWMEKESNR